MMRRSWSRYRVVFGVVVGMFLLAGLGGCLSAPSAAWDLPQDGSTATPSLLRRLAEWVVLSLEVAGIAAIVGGAVIATVTFVYRLLTRPDERGRLTRYREQLGQVILLGLEFLVGADIVGTVAVTPNFETVGALALIILVRTFLSFALEVETTGQWPWQRRGRRRDEGM